MKARTTIKKLIEQAVTFEPSGIPYEPVKEGRAQDAAFRKFLRTLLGATDDVLLENFFARAKLGEAVEHFRAADAVGEDLRDEERRS